MGLLLQVSAQFWGFCLELASIAIASWRLSLNACVNRADPAVAAGWPVLRGSAERA